MKYINDLRIETKGQTRLLWYNDYYDGPRSGLMLWDNKKCWYKIYDEEIIEIPYTENEKKYEIDFFKKMGDDISKNDDEYFTHTEIYYLYYVYNLDNIELEKIEYNHEIFKKYVGTHTDYDLNGKRNYDGVNKDKNMIKKYFDNKVKIKDVNIDLSEKNIIGKFKY